MKVLAIAMMILLLVILLVLFGRHVDPRFMSEDTLLDRGRWDESTGEPLNMYAVEFDRRNSDG